MTTALPAEVRELLGVVLVAIDIPYPATAGDATHHQEVLAEQVMHTTITLRHVLAREGTSSQPTCHGRRPICASSWPPIHRPATSPGPGLGPRSGPPPRTPGVGMAR
jgi:hypothetical protein